MIKKRQHERGQALVIIVAAMIGLIGMVGLAVDGGMAFSDRRHAQNAADTAALAGSLARVNEDSNWRSVAWDVADENGYDGLLSNDVEVYLCSDEAASCTLPAFANPDDYVQVIITTWFDTFFAKVVGIPTVTNRVEAISLADTDDSGPLANGEAIVSLRTDCTNTQPTFFVNGGPEITLNGGGLFVNSQDPSCGFVCNSSEVIVNGNITTAGGELDTCGGTFGNTSQTGSPLDYPILLDDIGLDVPSECDGPAGTYTNYPAGTWAGLGPGGAYHDYWDQYKNEPITVIHPGFFNQFPPPKVQPMGNLNDVMFLAPEAGHESDRRVYCVADVLRWNQDKFVLIGHDVTLFIRAGYDFSFTQGTIRIDAPPSGDYAGYLIIVEPEYNIDGTVDPPVVNPPSASLSCFIAGEAENLFTGTIFAPYCPCTISGTGDPYGFNAQMLCYNVSILGDASVTFEYDAGVNGEKIDPPKIGITK